MMKTKLTSFLFYLALPVIILSEGCSDKLTEDFINGTGSKSVVYDFQPAHYFQGKERKTETPFKMKSLPMNSIMLNTKKEIADTSLTKYFRILGAYDAGGGDIGISFSPFKHFLVSANCSFLLKSHKVSGTIPSVWTAQTITHNNNGFFGSGYPSTYTYYGLLSMPYRKEEELDQNNKEIAVGYYNGFGAYGIWEAFAGWSSGNADNTYTYVFGEDPSEGVSVNQMKIKLIESRAFTRWFMQGNFGYSTSKTEASLCGRLTSFHFTSQDFKNRNDMPYYTMTKKALLLEPAVHFGWGSKDFRLFGDYSYAIPLSDDDDVSWGKGNIRMGVKLKF